MKARTVVAVFAAVAFLVGSGAPARSAEKKRPGEGDGVFRPLALGTLLDVPLEDTLSPAERAYLGLPREGSLALGHLKTDLVLVELFNASCSACELMAPVLAETWKRVEAREDLRGRVRFVAIGVGNNRTQVRAFHERHALPFPAVSDPQFAAVDAIGTDAGTPYLILLRTGQADGIPPSASAQVGYIPDPDRLLAGIVAALEGAATPPEAAALGSVGNLWRQLKAPLGEAELTARLVAAAAEAGLAGATVSAVAVSKEETFYRLAAGGRHLWAMVAGRAKICNVCHDIFFVVVFDDGGRIANLAPIRITKYGNAELNAKEVAFLKGRVVGRYLTQEISFDPEVDAVSTATMSSSLVFDTLRRLGETYRRMAESGLVAR